MRIVKSIIAIILIVGTSLIMMAPSVINSDGYEMTVSLQIDNPMMTVNGSEEEIDPGRGTVPVIQDGRTLVPIRAIMEAFGITVEYQENTESVLLTSPIKQVKLYIGLSVAYINQAKNDLDVAPKVINGRTMMPIRFVAEAFNLYVDWDGATRTVTVTRTAEPRLFNPDRYLQENPVSREKAKAAMDRAVKALKANLIQWNGKFVSASSKAGTFRYTTSDEFNWTSGMLTGCCWLAYEYTGDEFFRQQAEKHIETYMEATYDSKKFNDHDTGFIFSPSAVAGYRITRDGSMRSAAMNGAYILLDHYDTQNNFIMRSGLRNANNYGGYRTLVPSMLNIPLFFFAYEETGNQDFYNAAVDHYRTTMKYLIREDGSSFHHYQFDPTSGNPVGGLTFQGHSAYSTWSRGHSWLIAGFAIAYSYTQNEEILDVHKNVTYYYLNRLASDNIAYWDLDFVDTPYAPRDSSASAITTCGMLEMIKYLPDGEQKTVYKNAADAQMHALIDRCENRGGAEDGLIFKVSHFIGGGHQNECAIYGDYFYMEALMRYLNPDWVRYW